MTKQEIAKLPKYSKARCGGVYRISDSIYIDNVSGHGATKSHKEIGTRGFMNSIPMSTLVTMFPLPKHEDGSTEDLKLQLKLCAVRDAINDGYGIACPQLFLNVDPFIEFGKGKATVIDVGGLEALHVLNDLGVQELNVQCVLVGYSINNIDDVSSFYNYISAGVVANGQVYKNLVCPAKS